MNTNDSMKPDERYSSGLVCLCFASNLLGLPARPFNFSEKIASKKRGQVSEILSAAKLLHLKANTGEFSWADIPRLTFPVIAKLQSGEFITFVRCSGDEITAFDPKSPDKPIQVDEREFEALYSKQLILLRKTDHRSSAPENFGFSWFFDIILRYRKTFFEILIAASFVQIFSLAIPLFSQVIIDKVLNHNSMSTLYVLGVGMLCIAVFECVISVLQAYLNSHTSSRIDIVLNSKVVSHLLRLPLQYFENRTTGNVIAHIREVDAIRRFLTSTTTGLLLDGLFAIIFICVMFVYSKTLTVVALAPLPILIATAILTHYKLRPRLNEKFGRSSEAQSFLVETVSGIHTIKSLAIEPPTYLRWRDLMARYIVAGNKVEHINQISAAVNQITQRISTIAILWIGAEEVMNGRLTIGQLIAFQMIAMRVVQPIIRIARSWQEFRQIGDSIRRLGDIMGRPVEPIMKPENHKRPNTSLQISIQSLTFKHRASSVPAISDLSLTINAGEIIGIVGRSGSGKSTLAKLLQGLYPPTAGSIQFNEVDLRKLDGSQLRRKISAVLQDNFLFSGTIRENICIQSPNAPEDAVVHAAKMAGAHDFIEELPEGYNTLVGERGESLSGGQRQRISIARSLLAKPAVLIFDEATSALDYESEKIVRNNLEGMRDGRTLIMIAHRLSSVKGADRIFVLDNGQLVEHGCHAELIERDGLYRHLYLQQEAL